MSRTAASQGSLRQRKTPDGVVQSSLKKFLGLFHGSKRPTDAGRDAHRCCDGHAALHVGSHAPCHRCTWRRRPTAPPRRHLRLVLTSPPVLTSCVDQPPATRTPRVLAPWQTDRDKQDYLVLLALSLSVCLSVCLSAAPVRTRTHYPSQCLDTILVALPCAPPCPVSAVRSPPLRVRAAILALRIQHAAMRTALPYL